MFYFSRNKEIFKIDKEYERLSSGECGEVYTNEKNIFKVYFKDTLDEFRLDEEIFEFMKQIDSQNLMKIYEIYTKASLKNAFGILTQYNDFQIDAYLAKYYKKDDINVLFKHKDYLLESLKEIEKLFAYFTEYLIFIDDIKFENSICTENEIVIIDPDCFRKAYIIDGLDVTPIENDGISSSGIYCNSNIHCTMDYLIEQNKWVLISYFVDLLSTNFLSLENYELEEFGICGDSNDLAKMHKKIKSFYDLNLNKCDSFTDIVSKELKYVKTPLEYIIKS